MNENQKIAELDGVRGFASLAVLIAHCLVGPGEPRDDGSLLVSAYYTIRPALLPLLLGGVDLFFVLSGFLIGGILMDNRTQPNYFKAFWTRRAARILPVLFILVLSYIVALKLHQHFKFQAWDLWLMQEPRPPAWSYATFTQNFFIAVTGIPQPRWIAITWSLAIEEQFYLLFPLIVFFIRSRRTLVAIAIGGIALAIVLRPVFETMYGNWYAPYILLPSRMDSLLLGFLVAVIVRNASALRIARSTRRAIDVGIVATAYLICTNSKLMALWPVPFDSAGPFPPLKHTVLALMYALLILRIFLHDRSPYNAFLKSPLLAWFGLISYALYMYHQSINGVMHAAFFNDQPKINSAEQFAVGVIVMAMAIGLAYLSFVLIENPIRKLGHRVTYSGQPANADQSVPAKAPAASIDARPRN